MKGMLILADAATVHMDGTVSMLRAGIDRVTGQNVPILRASLVARIEGSPSERGAHNLELSCIDEDGKDRLPTITASFEIPPKGGSNVLVIGLHNKLNAFGLYQFNLIVDKVVLDSWNLNAVELSDKPDAAND